MKAEKMKAGKKLTDFEEYSKVSEQMKKLEAEQAKVKERISQIGVELTGRRNRVASGGEWNRYVSNALFEADDNSELLNELSSLQKREQFLTNAFEMGRQERDKVHGKYSREICESDTIRSQWVAAIGKILQHIKGICEANQTLHSIRTDLERDGISTGSLAPATFEIGNWSDPYGGKVVGYQRYVAEAFPELALQANEPMKSNFPERGIIK